MTNLPVAQSSPRPPRRRTLLGGIVLFGPATLTADCTIRDLSKGGARIRLMAAIGLPPPLALLIPTQDAAFEASVAWSRGIEIGVAFRRALNLGAPSSEVEKAARRLWIARRRA